MILGGAVLDTGLFCFLGGGGASLSESSRQMISNESFFAIEIATGGVGDRWLGVGVSIDIMYTDASGTIAARGWVCTGLVRVVCKLQLV